MSSKLRNPVKAKLPSIVSFQAPKTEFSESNHPLPSPLRSLFRFDPLVNSVSNLYSFAEEKKEFTFNLFIPSSLRPTLTERESNISICICFSDYGVSPLNSNSPNKSEFSFQFYEEACENFGVNFAGWIVAKRKQRPTSSMDIFLPGERTYDVGGVDGDETVNLDYLTIQLGVTIAELTILQKWSLYYPAEAKIEMRLVQEIHQAVRTVVQKAFPSKLLLLEWMHHQVLAAAIYGQLPLSFSHYVARCVENWKSSGTETLSDDNILVSGGNREELLRTHMHTQKFMLQLNDDENAPMLPPREFFQRVDKVDPNLKFSLPDKECTLFMQLLDFYGNTSSSNNNNNSNSNSTSNSNSSSSSSISSNNSTSNSNASDINDNRITSVSRTSISNSQYPIASGNDSKFPGDANLMHNSSFAKSTGTTSLSETRGNTWGLEDISDNSNLDNNDADTNEARPSKHLNKISKTTNINVKEGFLYKQGKFRENWKLRYFVLKPDGLYYYLSPQEYKPKGVIPVKKINCVENMDEQDVKALEPSMIDPALYLQYERVKFFFFFRILVQKKNGKQMREYRIAATSNEERMEWCNLLSEALRMCNRW